ncbi:MAG: PHP domain-containing protein [Chloroflexi bacterium]|nr:PHP domain-containing protein [Chloroflexota bacterium]
MIYKKLDLHVHTPRSVCYEDRIVPEANLNTSPEDIVKGALSAGLHAIAITDHNTSEGVEEIRAVAKKHGLFVFPGMEISSRGGHVLAIFSPETPISVMRQLLAQLGFIEKDEGDGFQQTSLWMDEVFMMIDKAGGVAIAAHIDRKPRGLAASEESLEDKSRLHQSRYLSALEITVPQDKQLWTKGLVPNFPKKYPCVQGSDAHAPWEIGRRYVYMDIPELSFDGLRLAFREYEERIFFPEEIEIEQGR